mmetsp:Transcript_5955/g.14305  ORF Transcript_5955/g.14305 Transcript_5955/m.14305 type:complete len:118 (-) Transcript_5955:3897-4250(-)
MGVFRSSDAFSSSTLAPATATDVVIAVTVDIEVRKGGEEELSMEVFDADTAKKASNGVRGESDPPPVPSLALTSTVKGEPIGRGEKTEGVTSREGKKEPSSKYRDVTLEVEASFVVK